MMSCHHEKSSIHSASSRMDQVLATGATLAPVGKREFGISYP